MKFEQYKIVLVNLDPTIGSEIKNTRPCIIVSPNEMNLHINTITICPIKSSIKNYPTRVPIELENVKGQIVIDQIRTIDKKRIIKEISACNKQTVSKIKSIINETFVL